MPAESKRPADHVVLVSIDAFRPAFCSDETWPAPTLQQLAWEGAVARAVHSVFPALTYPAHATLVTGALPARHGIFHNRPFDPERMTKRWHWHAADLRAPTLWDAVRDAGGTTASVCWPTTVGAAIDWNVPDIWRTGNPDESIPEIRTHTVPGGLFDELEREATGALAPAGFRLGTIAREDRVGDMAAYLFEHYRPTLLLLHLVGTDHIQHENGRTNPRTRRAVAAADRAIGKVLEATERLGLRERTAFVVTGDHGTIDIHTELRPNVWLAEAGLMEAREDRGRWRATFHASGGSAFLRLHDPLDPDAEAAARARLDHLSPAERRLFRIVGRDELDALGADPAAPFALAAVPGVVFAEEPDGPALRPRTGAGHGYHPEYRDMRAGFVAAGAGIRRGVTVPLLPIQNVAPLVASLLGLEFDTPDGVLFPGLLHEDPPTGQPAHAQPAV